MVPANIEGKATIQEHVRGSEPRKSDSPFTSFSEESPGVGKTYGDNVIEVDLKSLERDVKLGEITDVEVYRPEKVQSELQSKVESAKDKFKNNSTEKNKQRLDNAQRDLENSVRDREVLIKGKIPSKYLRVKKIK